MGSEKKIPYKIYLNEDELPKSWYNVRADMKNKPAPLLNPATLKPMTADDLRAVFCDELIAQELDETNAYIPIPQEIVDFYKMSVHIVLRKNCRHLLRFTINLKAITQAEATSLTLLSHRLIMQKSRGLKVLQQRPVPVSGVLHFLWHALISDLTVRFIW